jgi:cation diffusion facilitator family transporter
VTDIQEQVSSLKAGQRTAFIATLVTLLLALLKGIIGYLFGFDVLLADAFHSGADLLIIFASGFGLWLASRKKSARFPYGLYKAETLATLLIAAVIIYAGVGLFIEGYRKLFELAQIQRFPFFPAGAAVVSGVVSAVLARMEKKVGKAIDSQSLTINAIESFLDIFVSTIVLAGIVLAYFRVPFVEGAVIIGISLLISGLGLKSAWTSLLVLLDANLDPALQEAIEEKINTIYGVKGIGAVKIRQAGPFKMVECNIETSPTLPLYRAHELSDKVEAFIMENYRHIESVFIHVEPAKTGTVSAIIPVRDVHGLDSRVHGHFGRAPYFIIVRLTGDEVEIEDFYINEFLQEKKHIGLKVIRKVIGYKLDLLFTSSIGEISFYMLKDNFVDILRIEEGMTVREVLGEYRAGSLPKVLAPTHPLEESQVEEEKPR